VNGASPLRERFVHGEIYRKRPDVHAVAHSHSLSVIPVGVTRQPLCLVFHMSGYLRQGTALFDIRESAGDTYMLISNGQLGSALAATLGARSIVLMRGNCSTVVGTSIDQPIYRSIYADVNAS
jgi:ribulose-5-phosphate 4-epimerase/fuculose-1-phosphate aldolase